MGIKREARETVEGKGQQPAEVSEETAHRHHDLGLPTPELQGGDDDDGDNVKF